MSIDGYFDRFKMNIFRSEVISVEADIGEKTLISLYDRYRNPSFEMRMIYIYIFSLRDSVQIRPRRKSRRNI